MFVRQNKYSFYFLAAIELFYFLHITYILDPTIAVFRFSCFHLNI